jgi:type IV pilus biogenesis protein CpaD/CtpE
MKSNLRLAAIPLMLALARALPNTARARPPIRCRSMAPKRGSRLPLRTAPIAWRQARPLDSTASWSRVLFDRQIASRSPPLVPPGLAERRAAAISRELLRYGIVTQTVALGAVPANHALVSVGRYAVTLPNCPNWSQSLDYDFTNAYTSNYGCANASNLGLMVASPGDLVSGRSFSGPDAQPAAAAVQRYLTDRVKPPPQPTASPFSASTGGGDSGGATPTQAPGT